MTSSVDPAVAETEKLIRSRLEQSGQMQKMRAMVIDASLRALNAGNSDGGDSLFNESSTLSTLKQKDPQALKTALSIAVECLQFLGLNYSANVVAVESGMRPVELQKRDALVNTLNLGNPNANLPLISSLLASGSGSGAQAPAAVPAKAPSSSINNTTTSTAKAPAAAGTKTPAAAVGGNVSGADDVDGAGFPKPHKFSENSTYIISHWNNRSFYRQGQVVGQQMNIDFLDNCKLYLLDPMDSTNIDDCNDTEMVIAACEGSIFLRTSKNCVLTCTCKQLRLRDCENVEVRLFCSTDPVIESSKNITIKPFNARLPKLISSMKAAKLDPAVNRYIHVYDFTAEKGQPPVFKALYEGHGLSMVDLCAEKGKPECPPEIEALLAGKLQPAASCESGSNKSHDIKTGANAWKAAANETTSSSSADSSSAKAAPAPAAAPPPAKDIDAASIGKASDPYSSYSDSSSSSDSEKYAVDEDGDSF